MVGKARGDGFAQGGLGRPVSDGHRAFVGLALDGKAAAQMLLWGTGGGSRDLSGRLRRFHGAGLAHDGRNSSRALDGTGLDRLGDHQLHPGLVMAR